MTAYEKKLDTSGLECPLPVLKAKRALAEMQKDDVLLLICTDPVAAIDVPHFCKQENHALLEQRRLEKTLEFLIRKV